MSKGSWQRPMVKEKFDDSFERIFGQKDKEPLVCVMPMRKVTRAEAEMIYPPTQSPQEVSE